MRRARVLLVANNFPPVRGGSAVVYGNMARFARGQIVVLAPRLNYLDGLPLIGWREQDRRAPYRTVRISLLRTVISLAEERGRFRRLRFALVDLRIRIDTAAAVLRLILCDRIRTVCVGELLASGWLISLLRFLPGIRLIAYVHGEEITTQEPYDQHNRRRRALRAVHRIVVVSRFTFEAVRRLLDEAAIGKMSLIANGVDTSRFGPRGKRQDSLELYRLEGSFVFISVCRLLEKKGVDNAIRAFTKVARRHPGCRYLIVGSGPYRPTLEAIAAEAEVADRVRFAGQVSEEDLVDCYCLGDVFVMPNRELPNGDTEGFGLVFLEANACGLPVIAGHDGGSTDAVQHGVNGLVVDGRSVDEISAAMLALREDAVLRERLRSGALQVAAAAGWPAKTEAFLALCGGTAGYLGGPGHSTRAILRQVPAGKRAGPR